MKNYLLISEDIDFVNKILTDLNISQVSDIHQYSR